MTQQSRIDKGLWWDRAWSLVSGCTPVSKACDSCWSASEASMRAAQKNPKIRARYTGLTTGGHFNGTVRCNEDVLTIPLSIRKPTTWAVWTDLFHPEVPLEFAGRAFGTMARCPQHTFLVLTKRPERMSRWFRAAFDVMSAEQMVPPWLFSNMWLGTTVENEAALPRIGLLRACPAVVRFLSIEPLLEPLPTLGEHLDGISWVVVGCESGPKRRPCRLEWVESIVNQCAAAGTKIFIKQLDFSGELVKDFDRFPGPIRIRQWPEVKP